MEYRKIVFFIIAGLLSGECLSAENRKCGNVLVEFENKCDFQSSVDESAIHPVCMSQNVRFGKMIFSAENVEIGTDVDSGKERPYLTDVVDAIYCVSEKEIVLRGGNGGNCDKCEWYLLGNSVTGEILDSRKSNFSVKGLDKAPLFDIYQNKDSKSNF